MGTLAERQQELGLAFMALGYPMKSAAALCGNGTQENLCRPVTEGAKDHGSDGIFQWRLQRLTNLQTLPNWDTLPVQAHFVMLELQAAPGSQFFDMDYHALEADLRAGTKSLETLTLNITDAYERPSIAGREADKRIGYARDALAILERAAPRQAPAPQPAPSPSPLPSFPSPLPGFPTMPPIDPVFIAQIIQILAPLAESLIAGLVKGVITQLSTAAAAKAPAGVPSSFPQLPIPIPGLDLSQLQSVLGPMIQQIVAAELAKIGGAK